MYKGHSNLLSKLNNYLALTGMGLPICADSRALNAEKLSTSSTASPKHKSINNKMRATRPLGDLAAPFDVLTKRLIDKSPSHRYTMR